MASADSVGLALERVSNPRYVAGTGPSYDDLFEQLTEYARYRPTLKRIRRHFFATDEQMHVLVEQLSSR
jgi:hypothetical protein